LIISSDKRSLRERGFSSERSAIAVIGAGVRLLGEARATCAAPTGLLQRKVNMASLDDAIVDPSAPALVKGYMRALTASARTTG